MSDPRATPADFDAADRCLVKPETELPLSSAYLVWEQSRQALAVEFARVRAEGRAEGLVTVLPAPRPLRWNADQDSTYVGLEETDDCFSDVDTREGMARRLEATARDMRAAIREGREGGPIRES